MTYWLSYSPEQLRQARTCQRCGCNDADIDLGLCFDCFRPAQMERLEEQSAERAYYDQMEAEYYAFHVEDGSHI
jgi:hypothetical protein